MSEYEALAKNVIRKSLQIQPKENVIVESWNHGLDAAKEIVYQLRAVGARPMLLLEDEETHWRSVENLPPAKLGQVSKSEWAALDAADAYIFLPGPADIARLRANLPKAEAAFGYNEAWYGRAKKAGVRAARIALGYVSPERASSYGVDYAAWRQMILDAASADFTAVSRKGRKVADLLSREADVDVSAPNGTHLTFRLKGRDAMNDDGIVDAQDLKSATSGFMTNVPPGQAYVAPDEASAEGVLVADLPTPYMGAFVRGLTLTFEGGQATWTAAENAEGYRRSWEKAKGPKDRIGALGLGLNPSARGGFLQNDLVSGVVELGLGGNASFGGKNKTDFYLGTYLSAATVKVGKRTVVQDGQLTV